MGEVVKARRMVHGRLEGGGKAAGRREEFQSPRGEGREERGEVRGAGGWVTKGTRGRKRITDSPVWA